MDNEMMFGLAIITFVAAIMVIIGICQVLKKDSPVGFYNLIEPPKGEKISNILQWNKKHGMIWIIYGICIELGFWIGYVMPIDVLEIVFMMGGVIIPLPFMIMGHRKLEREYRIVK